MHRFCAGRDTGTTIMELKLEKEFVSVDRDTLFLVLIDIMKEYSNLNQGILLQTIEWYGAGPKIWVLLA